MTFQDILAHFRKVSNNERLKGTLFELLIQRWFLTAPLYKDRLTQVWMWSDFPYKTDFGSGNDVGIDLVALDSDGCYWAIQCKCYDDTTTIDKPAVDSFITTSGRSFNNGTVFSHRLWVSTSDKWTSNAEAALENQSPAVIRIGYTDLENSGVDWDKIADGHSGAAALQVKKKPLPHQEIARDKCAEYFKDHTRGKLIMACGTGKTYTSLVIAEHILEGRGLVLFMVPSIALLGQTLEAWAVDAKKPIKAIPVCSDSTINRKKVDADADLASESLVDLPLPATTDVSKVVAELKKYQDYDGLTVVYSTYQSIEVVMQAQKQLLQDTDDVFGTFDLVICDEAHRTTGVIYGNQDESNFTKIHSQDNIFAFRRLYMTATPRLYGDNAKGKAKLNDDILCSMDDENLYGEEIYRVNFDYAVQHGLLTDYKVLVLTVKEEELSDKVKNIAKDKDTSINFDDTSKLIGCINALSKRIYSTAKIKDDDDDGIYNTNPMQRAIAFCSVIQKTSRSREGAVSSKEIEQYFPQISQTYIDSLKEEAAANGTPDESDKVVKIKCWHVDGGMSARERNEKLNHLRENIDDPYECHVISNVRCLSEGVDVPALDAVLFLSSRSSQIDVVQSVGRVMRNFRKGLPGEKKFGYIVIPIVVPAGVEPEKALDDNERYKIVWDILNALRAHDDHFNAIINSIALNKKPNKKIQIMNASGRNPFTGSYGAGDSSQSSGSDDDYTDDPNVKIARQLQLNFGDFEGSLYARMVQKVGDRMYWDKWSHRVGAVAQKFIERISRLVIDEKQYTTEFGQFLSQLQENLNPSVDAKQAIEMLAQHMILRPVFDALFEQYQFVKNNAVSVSMEKMLQILSDEAFEKDTEILNNFYDNVKANVGTLDNLAAKQTVIKNLYEQFFKGAFPTTVEQLGIVYTPVECVDFILRSVNDILKSEFDTSLTEENVHILDPFVGTGTFITRLMQIPGLIDKKDLERKYLNEIHCNEIVLLAYYVADVNIESVFHEMTQRQEYLNYDNICLTDTFELAESRQGQLRIEGYFKENTERINKQKRLPIRVIVGNPPYSIGQKSANDNAQNLHYEALEERLAETYVKNANATNKNSLYDSYIKAFRWASDRIAECKDGGIVAFISNGSWLDGNAQDGFRISLEKEFTDIYVFNLRGNQRTSGETSRKEGGKIFGSGSRTPVAITILVNNPAKKVDGGKATIHYHDIGDYLTREQKLKMITDLGSVNAKEFDNIITPNEHGDWISMRNDSFAAYPAIGDKDNKENKETWFEDIFCRGFETGRDVWIYNSSKTSLLENMERTTAFYNTQLELEEPVMDSSIISWTSSLLSSRKNKTIASFEKEQVTTAIYRPFFKQNAYTQDLFIHRPKIRRVLFPTPNHKNKVICVSGLGGKKANTCYISDCIPDLNMLDAGTQCFPLYYYESKEEADKKAKGTQMSLFGDTDIDEGFDQYGYRQKEAVTDWILKEVRSRFNITPGSATYKAIDKEAIFYYVYGILHSPQYRETFEADLKKMLPRIPIVDKIEDFIDFMKAGRKLADLHLNYETIDPHPSVVVTGAEAGNFTVNKMRFPSKTQKDTIIYNNDIIISNIPAEAYSYIVNGKSAIEWIMERYAWTQDKDSHIINDPNLWAQEHNQPRYILDLLLSVINVSTQTVEIVNNLPKLIL